MAQLSLALHFYHPLAHWLAARLRLEQELAADAWGACALGRQDDVSRDAGPDGIPPRQPRLDLAGPCVPPLSWHLCSENRNAAEHQTNPPRSPSRSRRGCSPSAFSPLSVCWLPDCAGRRARRWPRPTAGADRRPTPATTRTTWPSCRPMRRWSSPCGPQTLLHRREVRTLLDSLKQSAAIQRSDGRPSRRRGTAPRLLGRIPSSTTNPGGLLWFHSLRGSSCGWRSLRNGSALESAPADPRKRSVTTARITSAPPGPARRLGCIRARRSDFGLRTAKTCSAS